jgi:hypothetical protein
VQEPHPATLDQQRKQKSKRKQGKRAFESEVKRERKSQD